MADINKSLARQLDELSKRIEQLESRVGGGKPTIEDTRTDDDAQRYCAMPSVPERTFSAEISSHRARLIRWIDKKWVNGTRLHYYFFDSGPYAGGSDQREMVREGFEVWRNVGIGIGFEEVSSIDDAEIRIGFLSGDGAWSYVGRDVIDIPGQHERTMNFGWDLTRDPRGVDTPVHEIGHTLGFPHEHQNPFAGIVWDEEAVYDYFGGAPNNWPRETTFHNVLRKLPENEVEGSDWDPDSVMHYGFPAGLILRPEQYRNGLSPALGLSDKDIGQARFFYPPLDDERNPRLEPFRLEMLSLSPGEQKNFTIEPTATGRYSIQTFGQSDTLMVLFEDVAGELRYMTADDDSGTGLNARIRVRLQRGRRYVLRVRLYLNWASGDTALLLW
ncbi:MAG: hypothetical protein HWE39_14960 [Oceanospirillaceae bacterium]|nr:hypothetical protein [Oceanospirillaceae bacterium]